MDLYLYTKAKYNLELDYFVLGRILVGIATIAQRRFKTKLIACCVDIFDFHRSIAALFFVLTASAHFRIYQVL